MEKWVTIKGFDNYEISDTGKVRSLNYNNTNTVKILKPKTSKQGCLEITLSKNDKRYYRTISRLVWETFTNQQLCKNDIIMYKDEDKTNCSLSNLYLITRGKLQEMTYDLDNRYKPKHEYYDEELSIKEISKRTGIDAITIRSRLHKLEWNIYEAAEIPKSIHYYKYKKGGNKNIEKH